MSDSKPGRKSRRKPRSSTTTSRRRTPGSSVAEEETKDAGKGDSSYGKAVESSLPVIDAEASGGEKAADSSKASKPAESEAAQPSKSKGGSKKQETTAEPEQAPASEQAPEPEQAPETAAEAAVAAAPKPKDEATAEPEKAAESAAEKAPEAEETSSETSGGDDSLASATAADTLTASAGDDVKPVEGDARQEEPASAAGDGGDSGIRGSGTGGSGSGGSGSGGGDGPEDPAAPPPPPPPPGVSRRGGLLKGVALGGVLVVAGYVLAVGTSDLWLGKVMTPESLNDLTQRLDQVAKNSDAANKAATSAVDQTKALTERLDKLATRETPEPASTAKQDAAIKQLEDASGQQTKQLDALSKQLEDLAKRPSGGGVPSDALQKLQTALDQAQKARAALAGRIDRAVSAQQEAAKKLGEAVTGASTALDDLKTEVGKQAEAQKTLAALSERVASLESAQAAAAGMRKEIEGLRAAVSKLETDMGTLIRRLTSDPKALEDAVNALKDQAGKLESSVAALGTKLDSESKNLTDQFEALGKHLGTVSTALDETKKGLDGTTAGLNEAKQQLQGLDGKIAGLEKAAPEIQQSLGTLKGDLEKQGTEVGKLSDELSSFAAAQQQRIASAISEALAKDMRPRAAALALASAALGEAVQRGGSFTAEFDAVEKLAGQDPALEQDIASLKPLAQAGVSSRAGLISSFRAQIPKILAAGAGESEESGDIFDQAWGSISNMVEVRPVGEVAGDTPGDVVARAEQLLLAGNLSEAVAEVAGLKGAAATAAAPWLTEARARLLALQAAARLQQTALASLAAEQK